MKKAAAVLTAIASCALSIDARGQTTIDFEGTGAPTLFGSTVSLTERYAHLGVHFAGPALGEGGAIVDQSGGFGVNAHSGRAILAFNRVTYAKDPETIRFDSNQTSAEIFATGGAYSARFQMQGFSAGNLVTSDTITLSTGVWGRMIIFAAQGFDLIVLTEESGATTFILDDLTFVPTHSTLSLLCLGAAATARRRR